jgi:aminoglycoside phosphotransferase
MMDVVMMEMLRELLGPDATWSAEHEGASGTALRVSAGGATYWAKGGPSADAEHERLRWLAGRLPVPEVVAHRDGLLLLADVGAPSLATAPADVGAVHGGALRALHALPVADCPFDGGLDAVLARAEAGVRAGLVDPGDFDDDHAGMSPEDVLDRLRALRPSEEDAVVTHGDYTTTNVLVPAGGAPVLIDVPALGVADRHRDLAIARRELDDDGWAAFLAAYGPTEVDTHRLYYYRLLDELL